ncbi:hypothetical protein FN846DRAFT_886013 [Sphaerosporella brunnea]|uniref:Uncharacterized protein n=1 Tax=Sphaerosporella brunnea TaxID=1250544 RepID=A0A5J5FB40_9PEZI|nr:hypothetical protein FN846DRAFT_886013 [Sphaerosporella brunnea]
MRPTKCVRKDPPAPRHLKKAAPRPTSRLAKPTHELLLEIGQSLTESSDIYHLMRTCRTMRDIFDAQLYSTAVRMRHRLKLMLTRNHAAVRRLLATGALAVDLDVFRQCDHGLVERTQMVYVAVDRLRINYAAQGSALGQLLKEHGVRVRPTGAPTSWEWMMAAFPDWRPVVCVVRVLSDTNGDKDLALVRWELPL